MANFNFNTIAELEPVSSAKQMLKPWGIYDVVFKGAAHEQIKGKKDENAIYDVLKINFEGKDGYYTESIFFPKEEDSARPQYDKKDGGGKYFVPSNLEVIQAKIAQIATVLNPVGFKKMQSIASKFKTFKEVADAFCKILEPAKEKETKIKLCGKTHDDKIVPCIGKFLGINKSGGLFVSGNFIGDNLYFSDYEKQRKAEYESMQPTTDIKSSQDDPFSSVGSESNMDLNTQDTNSDIDFDSLLN